MCFCQPVFENHLEESWIENVVFPRRLLILYDFLHNQPTKVDPTVVSNCKSYDLNHFGYPVESADLGSKDMANCCEEQMPLLGKMIRVYDLGNHIVLIQRALHPCEESEKIFVGRIINKVVCGKMKGSV